MSPLTVAVLAHHDDEVFCVGPLGEAAAAGSLRILWVTAGGLAPAARRRREGRAVAAILGLRPSDAVSLGLPDQGAVDHLPAIVSAITDLMGDEGDEGDEIDLLVPAYEGGHPDHDAVNAAAAQARTLAGATGRRLTAFEFAMYRRGNSSMAVKAPFTDGDIRRLGPEDIALRRSLAHANLSQTPSLLALAVLAKAQRRWDAEPIRELPTHDYTQPPSAGRVLYEMYCRRRHDELARAVTGLDVEGAR